MATEKIEAIKNVTEMSKTAPSHEVMNQERVPPNKEHFQSLMSQDQKNAFGVTKIDGAWVTPEGNEIALQSDKELFDSQKMGISATNPDDSRDQHQKKKQQQVDEVESVNGSTRTNPSKASLTEEVNQLNKQVQNVSQLTPEQLKEQANKLITQIESVKNQLSNSQTTVKPAYKNVLHNHLQHIDENLKIALSKAGVEYTPPEAVAKTASSNNPLERFLGLLTNGQNQLQHLSTTIDGLELTNRQLSPASMLTLQIKVGFIQQQMELFTSILNKALESTKTIMNVQV